ncbi:MAG TPA: hypothetical protein PKC49_08050, partial [Phycisphaerae bacterium]|nr:hypothetical protein [Phycisphaerae bacterium]
MKRLMTCLASMAFIAAPLALAGEATAISTATNGGRATANATARGNSSSTAIARPTNGGRGSANRDALARGPACADSRAGA